MATKQKLYDVVQHGDMEEAEQQSVRAQHAEIEVVDLVPEQRKESEARQREQGARYPQCQLLRRGRDGRIRPGRDTTHTGATDVPRLRPRRQRTAGGAPCACRPYRSVWECWTPAAVAPQRPPPSISGPAVVPFVAGPVNDARRGRGEVPFGEPRQRGKSTTLNARFNNAPRF